MNKHVCFLISLLAVVVLSVVSSCHIGCIKGSGNPIAETRTITPFSKIDISGAFKINIKQDSSLQVTITADDNLLKYIRTQVNGNKLRIYTRKNFCNDSPITVNLGVNKLEEIKSSGAVELATNGRVNVQNLKLDFSGASKIDMELSAADIKTEISGASEISLKGQAASHDINVSGVGKLHAPDFVVGVYKINSSGAADCDINVLKSLKTNTSGSSNITYHGNPSNIQEHKSGSSSLKKVQ